MSPVWSYSFPGTSFSIFLTSLGWCRPISPSYWGLLMTAQTSGLSVTPASSVSSTKLLRLHSHPFSRCLKTIQNRGRQDWPLVYITSNPFPSRVCFTHHHVVALSIQLAFKWPHCPPPKLINNLSVQISWEGVTGISFFWPLEIMSPSFCEEFLKETFSLMSGEIGYVKRHSEIYVDSIHDSLLSYQTSPFNIGYQVGQAGLPLGKFILTAPGSFLLGQLPGNIFQDPFHRRRWSL